MSGESSQREETRKSGSFLYLPPSFLFKLKHVSQTGWKYKSRRLQQWIGVLVDDRPPHYLLDVREISATSVFPKMCDEELTHTEIRQLSGSGRSRKGRGGGANFSSTVFSDKFSHRWSLMQ